MKIDPKRVRVLFLDDEHLPVVEILKQQGYDVDQLVRTGALDALCDGRYWVIFFDVRGIGSELGGSGLNVLEYVAEHNPLITRFVYSAKPFEGSEAELVRKYATKVVPKDTTILEIIRLLEETASGIGRDSILEELSHRFSLSWWQKLKLRLGFGLSRADVLSLSRKVGATADAIKVVSNCVKLALAIFAAT